MGPLDDLWTGILFLLTPIVTPDWGKLIALIPLLLLLLVLAYLALLARAWTRLFAALPVRGPRIRERPLGPMLAAHLAFLVLGICVVVLGFVTGARGSDATGAAAPLGVVVNFPILALGMAIVIGTGGSLVRQWERHGRPDTEADAMDRALGAVGRHPGPARRAVAFGLGTVLAILGLMLGTTPGYTGGDPVAMAVLPLLVLGLALAIGAAGSTVASVWRADPDFDPPAAEESSSLVPAGH